MNSRKIIIQLIVIALILFGLHLNTTVGESRTGREASQDNTRQEIPSTTTPKKQIKRSTNISTEAQSKPLLLRVENQGCIYPGDLIRLRGQNLGKPGSYNLYLRTGSKAYDLTGAAKNKKWTNTTIEFQLPQSIASNLPQKGVAQVGFQKPRGKWLTFVKFNLCRKNTILKKPIKSSTTITTAAQPKPLLLRVENDGCSYPGDIIRLRGHNLGKPGSYKLYLQTSGKTVDLTGAAKGKKWTSTTIEFQLPQSITPKLSQRGAAQVGFQEHKGRWLTSVRFNLCQQKETLKAIQSKPQLMVVENTGCVSPGGILRLKGKNFGKPGSYNLSLQSNGKTVDVTAAAKKRKWTNSQIELELPQSLVQNGKTVRLGFKNKNGNWVANTNFTLCRKIEAGSDPISTTDNPSTPAPDLIIAGIGVEETEDIAINMPPFGYSMVPAINYVFTIRNIGSSSAGKNHVFIECFGPNGGECPYGLKYDDGEKIPIKLTPAPSPDFHISNSQQKITVGPFPLLGEAKQTTWRITVDSDKEVLELHEDNNMKVWGYQEPQTDLSSLFSISLDRNLNEPQSPWVIVPNFQLFSGIHWDTNKEIYQKLVKSGPSKVLIECFSHAGFKCPPDYPLSVEVGYDPHFLCEDLGRCQYPDLIGNMEINVGNLFGTKTKWVFKATVDADNRYPEMDENNNVEYATISWAGDSVEITDAQTKSEISTGTAQNDTLFKDTLPPVIDWFLVLPEKHPVPMPFNSVNPGSTILLQGQRFLLDPPGEVDKQRIFLFFDFGAVLDLDDLEWLSEKQAMAHVPDINYIKGTSALPAYLRIVRNDGKQSPPKDIQVFPTLATMEVKQLESMKLIEVDHCGDDSNTAICNWQGVSHDPHGNLLSPGDSFPTEHWKAVSKLTHDHAISGVHSNCFGCVGNDVGYDEYTIKLNNGWIISKADFRFERYDADPDTKILSYTKPAHAEGKSEWTARVDWQVDEGMETIWYGYAIEIAGPPGTSPF